MSFAAEHIGFVIASYALSAIVIAGLIAGHILRAHQVERRLKRLEDAGAPRRRKATEVPNEQ